MIVELRRMHQALGNVVTCQLDQPMLSSLTSGWAQINGCMSKPGRQHILFRVIVQPSRVAFVL
jgi:hypothetical protein